MQKNNARKIHFSWLLLLFVLSVFGQNETQLPVLVSDSIAIRADSSKSSIDTLGVDSLQVQLSKDALDASVIYTARDSMEYDIENKKIYLFGSAKVEYTSITLEAGFIELDWENNIVTAEGILDSLGKPAELPHFKDGDQDFTANRMRYNFKTQKGIIYDVTTKQQNLYVLGAKSKFQRTDVEVLGTDSTYTQDIIFSEDAIFTTCNHPEPHFGIRSKRQKVIPGKLVVVGPSRLEIAGIPTPIYLPFAFFPTTEKRTQGLIFPRGYEFSEQWGFGLRNIGYYVPINEYLDATASVDVYFKGTLGVSLSTNFKRRYRYNGSASISYRRNRVETPEGNIDFAPSMGISLNLNQDAAAHPTRSFGGSLNIQSNEYQATNFNDARSVTQASYNSNLSYRQKFPDQPFSLSAGLRHSQNRNAGTMSIDFPNLNFQTQTIYPFKSKKVKSKTKESWYEKIAFRYTGEARASFTGRDTFERFFQIDSLRNGMKVGARHNTTLNTSFRVLKNINVTPSLRYTNYMNFQYIKERFIEDTIVTELIYNPADSSDVMEIERIVYSEPEDDVEQFGFKPIHEYSASVSANTALFRTLLFKNGKWLRGLRHVVKPNISFNYSPDYRDENFGYFQSYERINQRLESGALVNDTTSVEYSIFQNSLYRGPSGRKQMAIGYSVLNLYEAKIFSKRDSTEKKIRLMDNISFNGNYNFAADSLNFSPLSGTASTRLFKGLSTFSINASWDPYAVNENGQRINTFYSTTSAGKKVDFNKLLRFQRATFRLTTNISVDKIRKLLSGEDEQEGRSSTANRNSRDRANLQTAPEEAILDLLKDFRLSHNFNFDIQALENQKDTIRLTTHTLSTRGNIQLTPNWALRVGNIGYDFVNKRVSYPDFGFRRNLHCWTLEFNWQPTRGTYGLNLYVTDSPLNFIKIPYGRNVADGRFQGL